MHNREGCLQVLEKQHAEILEEQLDHEVSVTN